MQKYNAAKAEADEGKGATMILSKMINDGQA